MTPGRVIWIQSSWNEFYNFSEKPSSVIDLLLEMIGPERTLVMPAVPLRMDPERVLVIDREPVSTGLICEIFRRYPRVVRSIHLSSSVIALGPQAEYLVKDHQTTQTPWDPATPYQRLMEADALCIGMGVGRFLPASLRCMQWKAFCPIKSRFLPTYFKARSHTTGGQVTDVRANTRFFGQLKTRAPAR